MKNNIVVDNKTKFRKLLWDEKLNDATNLILVKDTNEISSTPKLLTAYYDTTGNRMVFDPFYFVDGMTWEEYINSDLNIIGFVLDSNGYVKLDVKYLLLPNGNMNKSTYTICEGYEYYLYYPSNNAPSHSGGQN